MKKILTFLNHERYQLIAIFFCVLFSLWGLCCESKVQSVRDPTRYITRDELRIEVEQFLSLAEIRFKNLDRQDELKTLVSNQVLLWSQTGTFNPMGLLPTILGLLGIGAIADNVKKRIEIKKLNHVS
ncbi:hypothetical protein ES707_21838 [subsurface metagenome]